MTENNMIPIELKELMDKKGGKNIIVAVELDKLLKNKKIRKYYLWNNFMVVFSNSDPYTRESYATPYHPITPLSGSIIDIDLIASGSL